MNEGHSALLGLELLRRHAYPPEDLRPGESPYDLPRVRERCCFTTHTPVDAGHDRFSYELVARIFDGPEHSTGVDIDTVKRLAGDADLNMTRLALNLSEYVNGVAKRHAEVSTQNVPWISRARDHQRRTSVHVGRRQFSGAVRSLRAELVPRTRAAGARRRQYSRRRRVGRASASQENSSGYDSWSHRSVTRCDAADSRIRTTDDRLQASRSAVHRSRSASRQSRMRSHFKSCSPAKRIRTTTTASGSSNDCTCTCATSPAWCRSCTSPTTI